MSTSRTQHASPPFRAEHVGSLLRTQALLEKREAFDKGQCTLEEVRTVEDLAVEHVCRVQLETGIGSITDGEYRR